MKRSGGAAAGRSRPGRAPAGPDAHALSRARTTVVPTAHARPPRSRQRRWPRRRAPARGSSRVHLVVRRVLDLDGAEGARADVKGDGAAGRPHGFDGFQQLVVEVEAGGGSGDGALLPERTRSGSGPCPGVRPRASGRAGGGRDRNATELRAPAAGCRAARADRPPAGRPRCAPRAPVRLPPFFPTSASSQTDQGFPSAGVVGSRGRAPGGSGGSEQENLGGGACRLAPEQPGRQHPGVVDDQQVVRDQQVGQVAEAAVLDAARGPMQHQQARVGTARRGVGGDSPRRQLVVEEGSGADRIAARGRKRLSLGLGIARGLALGRRGSVHRVAPWS